MPGVPVMATVPLAGWVIAVMVRVSPGSGSVSLPNTLIGLALEPSTTVAVSSTATGASLTLATTLRLMVAVSVCARRSSRLDRPWKCRPPVSSLTSTVNSSGPV